MKHLYLLILIFFYSLSGYSQTLLEDALLISNITTNEKKEIEKNGFYIRPETIYYKRYPLLPKEAQGGNKDPKPYMKCTLKVIKHKDTYLIFAIGKYFEYYYDGTLEFENENDENGNAISNIQYDRVDGRILSKSTFQNFIYKGQVGRIQSLTYFFPNGSLKFFQQYLNVNNKLIKVGKWIYYNDNGDIVKNKEYNKKIKIPLT